MSVWQESVIAISAFAIIGAVLQPFISQNGSGKLVRFILSVCYIGMLMLPFRHISGLPTLNFEDTDASLSDSIMLETLREQVESGVNNVLTDSANAALEGYRLQIKKAVAVTDIDDERCISINQVIVYTDARNYESKSTILAVLRQQFGVEVVIKNDEG